MFLSPTVTRLTDPALGNHLKILCLSVGNADGLGDVRRKELIQSARYLGVESENDVLVVDDQNTLPDSMKVVWDKKLIADLLMRFFAPNSSNGAAATSSDGKGKGKTSTATTRANDKAPEALIDVIITFDKHGVSSHPNHTACYGAAIAFLDALMAGREGWACPVDVYTLTSVSIGRKYSSVIDCLLTILACMFALVMSVRDGSGSGSSTKSKSTGRNWDIMAKKKKDKERKRPRVMLFVAGPGQWWRGIQAMTRAHVSQMRWFRWGWIGLSRYMVVNDLRRVVR